MFSMLAQKESKAMKQKGGSFLNGSNQGGQSPGIFGAARIFPSGKWTFQAPTKIKK
jgi:hypothetical protein